MKLTRVLSYLALSLLAAAPARAEFTPEERPSAVAAFEAARNYAWAQYWSGAAVQASKKTQTREALADLVANLSRAERSVYVAPHALAGWYGNPVNHPRSEQLAQFRFHLARAIDDSIPGAMLALQRARQVQGESAAYYEALASVDQLIRYEVEPRLRKVDPSLPYADPTPHGLLPGQTVATFVKPHGDYVRGVRHSNDGANYAGDSVDEGWLPFYRALRTNRIKWGQYMGGLLRGRGFGVAQQIAAARDAFSLGDLDDPHTEAREGPADRFCQVLFAAEQLTDAREGGDGESVAETLFNLTAAWGGLAPAVAEEANPATRKTLAAALERALVRVGDWWANGADAFSWSLFRFENEPQKTRCR